MKALTSIAVPVVALSLLTLAGCSESSSDVSCAASEAVATSGAGGELFTAEVWADNWFSLSVDGVQVAEDVVPITTERSFNAQCVTFKASYPFTLGLVSKDFVENASGLEYIGESNQQIGDGGVILQVKDSSGAVVAATSSRWRGLSIFRAPLNAECASSTDPLAECTRQILPEPDGWAEPAFDDSAWASAVEYTAGEVGAKDGYTGIAWDASAKIIWASDLKIDNTILWRHTVTK